jgi:hypothetical protein
MISVGVHSLARPRSSTSPDTNGSLAQRWSSSFGSAASNKAGTQRPNCGW